MNVASTERDFTGFIVAAPPVLAGVGLPAVAAVHTFSVE
jgi:hypothetical protein